MKISLVVATIGRTVELRRLLASLVTQTHRDFEIIIVDQNPDDRLLPILAEFEASLPIRRVTSPPGASRARNVGARETTGEIVCFPDDDCWYPNDFLGKVDDAFGAHPDWDAMLGDAVDESGIPVLPWRDQSGRATKPICWRRAVCFVCILRSSVLDRVGGFDEELAGGAGTVWASGEDNDLMLRVIEHGYHVQYEADLKIHHPRLFLSFDKKSRSKRYGYSLGDGKLLRKHPMPMWWRVLFFGVPLGRMAIAMLKFAGDETRFHWATSIGRIRGFRLSA